MDKLKYILLILLVSCSTIKQKPEITINASEVVSSFPTSILSGVAVIEGKEYFDGHKWYSVTFDGMPYLYSSMEGAVFSPVLDSLSLLYGDNIVGYDGSTGAQYKTLVHDNTGLTWMDSYFRDVDPNTVGIDLALGQVNSANYAITIGANRVGPYNGTILNPSGGTSSFNLVSQNEYGLYFTAFNDADGLGNYISSVSDEPTLTMFVSGPGESDALIYDINGQITQISSAPSGSPRTIMYGQVLVEGGTTGDYELEVNGDLSVSGVALKTGGGTWGTLSDERIKDNIKSVDPDLIYSLVPISYTYKGDTVHYLGYTAQNYQTVFPEQVEPTDSVLNDQPLLYIKDQNAANVATTAAVIELKKQIDLLKAELDSIKNALKDGK